MKLTMVLPQTLFTRALFDDSVKVEGFDVAFAPSGSTPTDSARLRGRIERQYAGGEQVIPDYLVRLSRRVGQPLTAIPVFLARGMVHRKYIGRRGGPRPSELNGAHIGVSRLLAATSVQLRGVLRTEYGLDTQCAVWLTAESLSSDDSLAAEWPPVHRRLGIPAAKLLDLLAAGELEAVLYPGGGGGNWYEWVQEQPSVAPATTHYQDLATLMQARPELEFSIGNRELMREWFARNQVYPLYHMVAVHAEIAKANPGLLAALMDAFSRAALKVRDFLSPEHRKLYDREIKWLGVDPNESGLTELNVRSIEYVLDVLASDGMIERRPRLQELFPATY